MYYVAFHDCLSRPLVLGKRQLWHTLWTILRQTIRIHMHSQSNCLSRTIVFIRNLIQFSCAFIEIVLVSWELYNWGEPEGAPPSRYSGWAVCLFIYMYPPPSHVVHTWSLIQHVHIQLWSRSQLYKRLSFPGLHLRDRESDAACTCRDSSCGW